MMGFGNIGIMFITAIVSCAQGQTLNDAYAQGQFWVKLNHPQGSQQYPGLIVGKQGDQITVRMWNEGNQKFWTKWILPLDTTVTCIPPPSVFEETVAAMFQQMQTFFKKEDNKKLYSRILNFKVSTIVNQVIEGSKTNIKEMQKKKLEFIETKTNLVAREKRAIEEETKAMTGFTVKVNSFSEIVDEQKKLLVEEAKFDTAIQWFNIEIQKQFDFVKRLQNMRQYGFRTRNGLGWLADVNKSRVEAVMTQAVNMSDSVSFHKYWNETNRGQWFSRRWLYTRSLTVKEIIFSTSDETEKLDQLKDFMIGTMSKTMEVNDFSISEFREKVIGSFQKGLQKCAEDQKKRNKIFKILGAIGIVVALVALVVVSVVSAGTLALPVAAGVGLAAGIGIGVETYLTEQPIKTAVLTAGIVATQPPKENLQPFTES